MRDCKTCNQEPLSRCCAAIVYKGKCGDCKEHADPEIIHQCFECETECSEKECTEWEGICPDCIRLLK